jgi:hypothetical protein
MEPTNLPRVHLTVGGHRIDARVAGSAAARATGLMHRQELSANEGMLFVCDEAAVQKFWMKDTPLALSVAFLDEAGVILKLRDMEPHSLHPHSSGQPVRFVLEMAAGWFRDKGIASGSRVDGPPFAATAAA